MNPMMTRQMTQVPLPFNFMPACMSVTRELAGRIQLLKDQGITVGMLGPGYPTIERDFLQMWKDANNRLLSAPNPALLASTMMGYTATEGPSSVRKKFAAIHGRDLGIHIDPDRDLIPCLGGTGAMDMYARMIARASKGMAPDVGAQLTESGRLMLNIAATKKPVAVFCSRPAYAGWTQRVLQEENLRLYSARMDSQGIDPAHLKHQIAKARSEGCLPALLYTIPTGHNPTGITFPEARRAEILEVARQENIAILEDGAYHYMTLVDKKLQPPSMINMDTDGRVSNIFSFSKLGAPSPRAAFVITKGGFMSAGGDTGSFRDLLVAEMAGIALMHSALSLFVFESAIDTAGDTLWNYAQPAIDVYTENRHALLSALEDNLGKYRDVIDWNIPEAGFFVTLKIKGNRLKVDDALNAEAIDTQRVTFVPMRGFYPPDARAENPEVGYDEMRLAFSFSEKTGQARRDEMYESGRRISRFLIDKLGLEKNGGAPTVL